MSNHKKSLAIKRKKCKSQGKTMSLRDKLHRCILKKPLSCISGKTYNKKTKKCRIKCIPRGKKVRKGTRNRCVNKSRKSRKMKNRKSRKSRKSRQATRLPSSQFGMKYEEIYNEPQPNYLSNNNPLK